MNIFPEWRECHSSQFEMLLSERDADDGDAEQNPKEEVGQANPKTSDANPNDVH